MTLEDSNGVRYATFPDLIVTIDVKARMPKTSAELVRGDEVLIVVVPKERIPLGAGVKDPEILAQVGSVIGKSV
jgi:DUF917 family protein